MAKREQEKDKLAEVFDNPPKVKASQEAREKSLQAFQDGLKENRSTHKKEKRLKFRKHLIGLSLTVAAAGLVTVLAFGAFGEPSPEDAGSQGSDGPRSEEHTSELQSRGHLVCRLLLEKKKKKKEHTIQ